MDIIEFKESIKSLTPKERVITELIILGNSTKNIAEKLNNSKRTIETHRQNIAIKFDKCGQGRLVLFLLKNRMKILSLLQHNLC